MELPNTEPDLIAQCKRDYEAAAQHGGQEAMDACFRLAWSQVHSRDKRDVLQGMELLEGLLRGDSHEERDLKYLLAVGKYRSRHYIDARRTLKELLEEYPEFRQAQSLLEMCEKDIITDGLVGVGVGTAIVGVAAAVVMALAKR
eukprot:scaffold13.g365.t1